MTFGYDDTLEELGLRRWISTVLDVTDYSRIQCVHEKLRLTNNRYSSISVLDDKAVLDSIGTEGQNQYIQLRHGNNFTEKLNRTSQKIFLHSIYFIIRTVIPPNHNQKQMMKYVTMIMQLQTHGFSGTYVWICYCQELGLIAGSGWVYTWTKRLGMMRVKRKRWKALKHITVKAGKFQDITEQMNQWASYK